MYPTISHLIYDLFGINIPLPIQTFGFWVAIAFFMASWIISIELKRKEIEGHIFSKKITITVGNSLSIFEVIGSLLIGFALGYKGFEAFFYYSELVENPQAFMLSTRGNLFGGIFLAIIYLYFKFLENKKTRLSVPKKISKIVHPYELTGNIIMIAAISGIIGAKIFHNLENLNLFLADPIGEIMSFSGLTFYGGLIVGAISVIIYTRKYNLSTTHLIDSAAPALILAYGIGRIGCQMSGDGDWGIENLTPKPEWLSLMPDWMWSYKFPNNVINAGIPIDGCIGRFCHELENPVWPTAFYEVIMSIIIFIILWSIRKKISIPGLIFCIYLIFNGVERLLIEQIRVNNKYDFLGGITQAEIISSLLIIIGMSGFIYLKKTQIKTIIK